MVQHDVDEGRRRLNFSNWSAARRGADESAESVQRGRMPPFYYTMMHPAAQLSTAELQSLLSGLTATFGGGRPERSER